MYFYIHKIYTNENEQTQLLEMCNNAGFRFGNAKYFQSLKKNTIIK